MGSGLRCCDLNNPVLQGKLFALPKDRQTAVLNALRKLAAMSWPQVYAAAGLGWEVIGSRVGPRGGRLDSVRIGRGFRAVAYRDGEWLRLLTLHPDHDTAYR